MGHAPPGADTSSIVQLFETFTADAPYQLVTALRVAAPVLPAG